MRTVTLKFHVVEKFRADMPPEFVKELTSLYRTAGIYLDLTEGDKIEFDPAFYPKANYESWVEKFKGNKKDREVGHLIIGCGVPEWERHCPPHTVGQLLDEKQRGVAAVYTSCVYILQGRKAALLQACAHEIGHIMNLGHVDVTTDFISTMDQAEKRARGTGQSWEAVVKEAHEVRKGGHPDYFFPPDEKLENTYPFAHKARKRLNDLAVDNLQPWGEKFEYSDERR